MRLPGTFGARCQPVLLAVAAILLGFGAACGGTAAAPTPTAPGGSPTSPAAAPVPSPQRPPLASPVGSPSPAAPAVVAQPTATATAGPSTTYVVKAGDTLLVISQEVYGDPTLWRRIYDANRDVIGDNPDTLKIEQELRIPPKE